MRSGNHGALQTDTRPASLLPGVFLEPKGIFGNSRKSLGFSHRQAAHCPCGLLGGAVTALPAPGTPCLYPKFPSLSTPAFRLPQRQLATFSTARTVARHILPLAEAKTALHRPRCKGLRRTGREQSQTSLRAASEIRATPEKRRDESSLDAADKSVCATA
jgi:hypothetical protein